MKEDYPLFVHWYQTLDWILTTVERFPKDAKFTLGNRVSTAGLTTVELIVEAIYTRQRSHILDRINMEIEKQRVLFRIAYDRRYISIRQYEHISKALDQAGRMVGGWKKNRS